MKKLIGLIFAVASVILIGWSFAQSSTRTRLDLRTGPIINSSDVSNLALVLSVEFPTVKHAYSGGTYDATKKYIGYFDSNTCYAYNGTSANGYFQPSGATVSATNYNCNSGGAASGFSGNFMNFASMSAIDIVRFALTGGDRVVDEDELTVLQRAYLPGDEATSNGSFYGSSYFSIRTLSGATAGNVTPFGSSRTLYVKSCNDKIFFGRTNEGSCTDPLNNGSSSLTNTAGATVTGTFKVRVKVCSDSEGPSRKDGLCKQYGNGHYKPVGEVQKNADKVRLAAFGYLLDQTGNPNERYGGVLRAPMKFVGPNKKDEFGIVSSNDAQEWDSNSGVFVAKPLNTSLETGFTTTGVVNYLNQFGRTGSPKGIYKQYDPVGELYYEAIRYFQNVGPSSGLDSSGKTVNPTNGITTSPLSPSNTKLDGYPVYTTWSDPMQTMCQRNYAMVVGDNNTHDDAQIPGSTFSGQSRAAESAPVVLDAAYWTQRLTSFETNGNLTYVDSTGITRTANGNSTAVSGTNTGVVSTNTSLDTTVTGSQRSSYLWAGVAYFANTQKIRTDKPSARVRTFVIDVDENGTGNINTTRSRSFYLAGKYGGFADVGQYGSYADGEGNPFKTWVDGTLTTSANEWLDADLSAGSPGGYFLASQPERLILAIRKIFAAASKPSGNLAGGSLSVSRLSAAKQKGAYYSSLLNPSDWSGTVVRTELTYNTATLKLEASGSPVWSAGTILTGNSPGTTTLSPIPLPANRKIFSYSNTSLTGVTFTWANIDAAVQTSLKTDPHTLTVETDADGQARLDYIRGVRSAESDQALNYRGRNNIMGDSINSAPVLKGTPIATIVDASYQTFYTSQAARTPTVYVGSNDGMLHAFYAGESATDTGNGKEQFAYVPRAISTKLNKLTNPGYVKEAYVDGSLTVTEARAYKSASSSVDWATVLVSGMGGGAKGLFALDVTTPASFGPGNVLWEFTDADDADMGHLLGEPKLVKLAMAGTSSATPDYRWFAMVTSGYNNYQTGGSADKQALFLLSLEKAPGTAWVRGTNYFKIYANNSTFATTDTTSATGMGMPGVAFGGLFGNAIYAYAGDLQGNMWKFDLSGASTTWTGSAKASVLFIARTPAGTATQPITVAPAVTLNVAGGYQIGFGTGQFIEPPDALPATAKQQSLYGIWDSQDGTKFERIATGSAPTVNGLITRTLTAGTSTISMTGPAFSYGTSGGAYRGWVADLLTTMERVVVDPAVDSGLMAVNSTIPGGDPCVSSGASNQYRYNPNTGISFATTGSTNTQGYLGSPSLLEVGETAWSTRNAAGRYVVTRKINSISPGVGGGVNPQESTVTTLAGRISWREITNFQ